MAYGLKYYGEGEGIEYVNNPSRLLRVEFWFKDYTGESAEVRLGGSPFVEKQRNTNDVPYGVNDCRYTIELVSDTLSIKDFYLEEDKAVLVKLVDITGTATTLRECYLISEDASESYEDSKKTLSLVATDGLELLKGIEFYDFQGKVFTGRNNAFWIINYCISKIGLCSNLNTTFNYRLASAPTNTDYEPLVFMELSYDIFTDNNCYEVLEKIATTLNCSIFQEDGEWWFAHLVTKDSLVTTRRKYSIDPSNLLSHGTLSDTLVVGFNQTYRPVGDKAFARSNNKVISEVNLKKNSNKILNANFQSGNIDNWNVSQLDSYTRGGLGTKLEPYYLQVNGYQPSGTFEANGLKNFYPSVPYVLYDKSLGQDPEIGSNKIVRISGRVLGNDVTDVFITPILIIESDSLGWNNLLGGVLFFYLNSSGEWIWAQGADSPLSVSRKIDENLCTKINLVSSDGKNKEKYSTFSIDSKSIADITIKQGWLEFVFNNQAYKINSSDFDKATLNILFSEGYGRTKDPQNETSYNPYVRYADLNLELIDNNTTAGIKKVRYINDQKKSLSKDLKIEKYFCDFVDNEQSIAITESGISTKSWTNGTHTEELLSLLNKDLMSLMGKPNELWDGEIKGHVKKYSKIEMLEYSQRLIPLSYSYNFFDNLLSSVRYIKSFNSYLSSTNTKVGVYDDDKEVPYDSNGDFTGGEVNDIVPNWKFDSNYITTFNSQSIFDGFINIDKVSGSGINWFNVDTGVRADYIKPSATGFEFKSESSPFTANLTFADLTADTEIKLPNSGTIITDETGWLLTANTLTAKSYVGSLNNFDVGFKRNDIEIGTLVSTGLDLKDFRLDTGAIQFNTATTQTAGVGKVSWNDTYGTLEFGLKGGNVAYRMGQSSIAYVKNADNAGLTKGTVVYPFGSDGSNKTVKLAQANAESTSSKTFGVIGETVTGGAKAFCITEGLIENINTSSLTEGGAVYLSPTTAGGFTSTKPSAPNHMVLVGFCVRSHATLGSIFVKVQNGFELDELHDVAISSLANNNLLAYESATSLWKNKTYAQLGLFTLPNLTSGSVLFSDGTTISQDNNNFFWDNTNKRVGLGVSTPSNRLHTLVGNVDGIRVQSSNSGFIEIGKTNAARFRWANDYSNANLLELLGNNGTGGTPNVNLFTVNNSNGNVGIGTTTPLQRLHNNISVGGVGIGLMISNDATNSTIGRGAGILFAGTGNANIAQIEAQTLTASNNTGGLIFKTSNSGTLTERMRITQNGDIMIGIGNPSYKLDVTGTGHFTGAVLFDAIATCAISPTLGSHLANKAYVDSLSFIKKGENVLTISLTNITLSGTQTVNGVALVAGNLILVAGQTTASQNGVYAVASGSWTRSTLNDTDTEIRGAYHLITNGTYANQRFINTNASTITVGTTAITYALDFGAETDPIFVNFRDTSRSANLVYASGDGTSAGIGTWRGLVQADIPTLNWSKITATPNTIGGYGITDYNSLWDTQLGTKTTTNLAEGTNLYYTQARFDTAFGAKSTTNLTEGSNLYFTNARVIASTLTGYTSGAGTITSSDTVLSAIQKLNGNIGAISLSSLGGINYSTVNSGYTLGSNTTLNNTQTLGVQLGNLQAQVNAKQAALSGTGFMSSVGTTISYSKNINLENTTFANQNGIIQKNGVAWLHDFNYGTYGSVTSIGQNIFLGSSNNVSGKFATQTWHGSYNVGIGGSALLANTTGAYNTSLGHNTLVTNLDGTYNTAIGYNSMYYNLSGYSNVGVGALSLYSNTTGYNNAAIGISSLYTNTTGRDNVAIGYRALYSNTTSSYNVAIGSESLYSNTSGAYNIGIAQYSLYSNTSGSYNLALGLRSLQFNTTGSYNLGIGFDALRANTTGTYNLGIGILALGGGTVTGSYNVGLGRSSLFRTTSGSNNTGLGYNSGFDLTTGSNNVFLGYRSGLGITTGSNNIVIGANTTGLSSSLSNYIILGDNAGFRRFIINDIGNTGIGLDNPLYKLHVNGDIKADANLIVDGNASFGLTNPLTITQKDYIQGSITSNYNEISSYGKWLRLNTDSGFSLRHNEVDAISFTEGNWKFNTNFAITNGEEINDWTGFNVDDRFRIGINENIGLAAVEMVYENSIIRNYWDSDGIFTHVDNSGNSRKYLREGDVVGGSSSIPNLQQVTEQGANSSIKMQFNGVNYATLSDLGTTQGLDSVLGNNNTANDKNIFLNGLSGAYTLGYDGTAKFYINHSSAGVLNMVQTVGTDFGIYGASNFLITSNVINISSLTNTTIASNGGITISADGKVGLVTNANSGSLIEIGVTNGLDNKTSIGRNNTTDYITINGQKYNFKLPSGFVSGDLLVFEYDGTNMKPRKSTIFASGGKNYLTV